MMPPHFPFPDDPKRRAEGQFFAQLSTLEDKWTVIYSLVWHGNRKGRTGDGEGDFIILHPNYGFFVAEVKGGQEIYVRNGEWFSRPHGGNSVKPTKDPFEQALSTSKALNEYLDENFTGPRLPLFCHFVVFPGHEQKGDISPAGKRDIIVDKFDLASPLAALQRVAKHWNRQPKPALTDEDVTKVVKALRPDADFLNDARVSISQAQRGIRELTLEQMRVLAAVRRQKRLLVNGTAGTGKTVLATESARFHAESGVKTLLLCFNRPLGEELQKKLAGVPNLTVGSFHSFAKREIENAGLEYDDGDLLPLLLAEAADLKKTSFGALVVDEAQDFRISWWDALLTLLDKKSNSSIHIFRDVNQDIYEGDPAPFLDEFSPVDLTYNCRNTLPIAELVHALGRIETGALSTPGPSPDFQVVGARSGIERKLATTLRSLTTTQGIPPSDIAILTDSSGLADALFDRDLEGMQLGDGTRGSIRVDTIQRFKGLESEAVICVFDVDHDASRMPDSLNRLGYIGLSRARTVLTVMGSDATLGYLRKTVSLRA
jgi:hypothetical protein